MRYAAVLCLLFILTGCSRDDNYLQQAIHLREQLSEATSCSFETNIVAEYGDQIYTFQLHCIADNTGAVEFTVTAPDSISGIRGKVDNTAASFSFEDKILAFPTLADGQLSPVSAPWVFINTLRGGYLSGCCKTEDGFLLSMDDSYQENALHLEIKADPRFIPTGAEIYWQQQRILTLEIENFVIE